MFESSLFSRVVEHVSIGGLLPSTGGLPGIESSTSTGAEPYRDCVVKSLLDSKAISLTPNRTGAPWVQLDLSRVPHEGTTIFVDLGTRHFLSATNKRRWKENGIENFAETVTYDIRGGDPATNLGAPNTHYGPYVARVVYQNDPAAGQWRLTSSGASDAAPVGNDIADGLAAFRQMYPQGCDSGPISQAVASAQRQAFAQIANNLAASAILARGPVVGTLVSRGNAKVYYTKFDQPPDLQNVDATLMDRAQAKCQSIPIRQYKNWRLPTFADLMPALTVVGPRSDWYGFVDTPDGQLWSQVQTPANINIIPTADPRPAWVNLQGFLFGHNRVIFRDALMGQYGVTLICVADL